MEIIVGIIFVVLAIYIVCVVNKNHPSVGEIVVMSVSSSVFAISLLSIGCILCADYLGYHPKVEKQPTALDVYNGKTTLEITYKNSIPVDTIVVWK